jgi:short subunit dehydrogenase-like uncharacterized protein
MQTACLRRKVHYLDITGEIPVFEHTFSLDRVAKEAGVTLISGAGFDVIPSDCLALWVANQVPGATQLEIAVAALSQSSTGTAKSALEMLPAGGKVRRGGKLTDASFGAGGRALRFPDRIRTVYPAPWGDLSTAYRTTGIPNITTYLALSAQTMRWMRLSGPLVRGLASLGPIRRAAAGWVERNIHGPDEAARQRGKSYLWAWAGRSGGSSAQAWLETVEGYRFTAMAAVKAVERVLAGGIPAGALSPAIAFGADFVLEIQGSRRMDSLPTLIN